MKLVTLEPLELKDKVLPSMTQYIYIFSRIKPKYWMGSWLWWQQTRTLSWFKPDVGQWYVAIVNVLLFTGEILWNNFVFSRQFVVIVTLFLKGNVIELYLMEKVTKLLHLSKSHVQLKEISCSL
jgi:hypothetical protein